MPWRLKRDLLKQINDQSCQRDLRADKPLDQISFQVRRVFFCHNAFASLFQLEQTPLTTQCVCNLLYGREEAFVDDDFLRDNWLCLYAELEFLELVDQLLAVY